jgi:hypothetical protein
VQAGDEARRVGGPLVVSTAGVGPADAGRARLHAADLVRSALGDDAPVGDDRDPVAELRRLVEVVRGEEDARPVVRERPDQVPERTPRLRVEARGRLVEEQQLGVAHDAERHVDAATLPARERADPGARLGLEADGGDHLVDVARAGVEGRDVGHLLAHGRRALLGGRLQHDADARPPVEPAVARVHAEHEGLAARAVAVALQDLDRGRLAGPVRTEQAERLALLEVERDAVQGGRASVLLREVAHAHDGW